MNVSLTRNEKLQLDLFKLMERKAEHYLQEDSYDNQDISNTKQQCVLLSIRKMCQVYKDLQDSSRKTKDLQELIISYLKIIYHSNIDKSIKASILKFLKKPSVKNCDQIISAIYKLDIEDFSVFILAALITHINKGNPFRKQNL